MKPVYLHIGLPRCASTLIENVFNYPKYIPYGLLRESGVKPLPRLYMELRRALHQPEWGDTFCQRLRDYHLTPLLAAEGSDLGDTSGGYFLTDEGLTFIDEKPGTRSCIPNRAAFAARLLDGFQPVVMLIVRNQVSYINSMYGLHLQNGGTLEFADYVDGFPIEKLDWLFIANIYAEAFGAENLLVFPLESACYDAPDVPWQNFMNAMARTMGIEKTIEMSQLPRANPSISPGLMAAQLEINRRLDPEDANTVCAILREKAGKETGAQWSLMTEEAEGQLRGRFAESNRLLFDRYMPNFGTTGYL